MRRIEHFVLITILLGTAGPAMAGDRAAETRAPATTPSVAAGLLSDGSARPQPSPLAAAAAQAAQGAQPPAAPPEGPRYVVTYVDVVPSSDAQALALLKGYRDAARKAKGNRKAEIWRQDGPRGRYLVVEEWQDEASRKAHRDSSQVGQFLDKLTPLRITAYDERVHSSFNTGPSSPTPASALLIGTHVDVIPAGLPKARELLQAQAAASRKDAGMLAFDVLQGARQNHFTVLEAWRDQAAWEGHITAAHTKTYREGLREQAIDGAPYDERLYRLVE